MKERSLGLLGKKLGMTRVFDAETGVAYGVTVVQLGPCTVLAKRTPSHDDNGKNDGYSALQLGFDAKPNRKVNKPEAGHLKKAGGTDKARRFVRELRLPSDTVAQYEVGAEISLSDLSWEAGALVDITGTSKGRGFTGVMKRHNFAGFRASHGTHEYFRHGGSIGCRKWPGRVFKGRKMAGQMGNRPVTTQNIEVFQVRPEENVVLVHGSVPGPKNGYVLVRPAVKQRTKKAA